MNVLDVRIGDRAEVATGLWAGLVGQFVTPRRPINPLASFAVIAIERAEIHRVWTAACERLGLPQPQASEWQVEEDDRIWMTFDVSLLRPLKEDHRHA